MCMTMSLAVRKESGGRDYHVHDYEHYYVRDTERYLRARS